jgi:hypothetical protein
MCLCNRVAIEMASALRGASTAFALLPDARGGPIMKTSVVALSIGLALTALAGCAAHRTTTSASPQTTIVTTPGSTTIITTSAPWCQGAYVASNGTNFGSCSR